MDTKDLRYFCQVYEDRSIDQAVKHYLSFYSKKTPASKVGDEMRLSPT